MYRYIVLFCLELRKLACLLLLFYVLSEMISKLIIRHCHDKSGVLTIFMEIESKLKMTLEPSMRTESCTEKVQI